MFKTQKQRYYICKYKSKINLYKYKSINIHPIIHPYNMLKINRLYVFILLT